MKRLQGKTALITGCNRGIGKAIAEEFAQEGANLICIMRKPNPEFKSETGVWSAKYGVEIEFAYCDMNEEDSIKSALNEIQKNKTQIDILVNNAGMAKFKPFIMSRIDDYKQMMQVNFYGPILIMQYVVKNMVKLKKGSIINLSSISCLDANVGNAAYGASKAAISSLTRTLSKELAKANIRVNAIAPGFVDTKMNSQISTEYMQKMLEQIALRRIAAPVEIAKLAVFLGSDDSSYITGQTIRIDGGI